jgi:FkbM family methyltransferase
MFCVDVGANCGYFTALMAGLVGGRGRVVAVEPNPDMVRALKQTIATNRWGSFVSVSDRAVWSKSGLGKELAFSSEDMGGGSVQVSDSTPARPQRVTVTTITLDDLLVRWPKVDLIKIDAEGAEVEIWRGMQRTLARNPKCVVAMEVSNLRGYQGGAFYREIEAAGFPLAEVIPTGDAMPTGPYELSLSRTPGTWTMLWLSRDRSTLEAGRPYRDELREFYRRREAEHRPSDSRYPAGLLAKLSVDLESAEVMEGENLRGRILARNIGTAVWLPARAGPGTGGVGVVTLRAKLLDPDGTEVDREFHKCSLTPDDGWPVAPGEMVEREIEIPCPPRGEHILEFDLVAEGVTWFAANGSEVARAVVQVQARTA